MCERAQKGLKKGMGERGKEKRGGREIQYSVLYSYWICSCHIGFVTGIQTEAPFVDTGQSESRGTQPGLLGRFSGYVESLLKDLSEEE